VRSKFGSSFYGCIILPRLALLLLIYGSIVVVGSIGGNWIARIFEVDLMASDDPMFVQIIVTCFLVYMALIALPFIPGVEIAFAMILMLGPKIVPLVYGATVIALCISFGIGRLVPIRLIIAAFSALGMTRATAMVTDLSALAPADRIDYLMSRAPSGWVSWLLGHRLLALGVLFNVPGNAIIGGGGGIAIAVGMSGLVSFQRFALTVVLATAPLPVIIILLSTIK